jgi:hypothetical protein
MLDHVDWPIPYHLQLLFGELREQSPNPEATVQDVDEAFSRLLGPNRRTYFEHWVERLGKLPSHEEKDLAKALLAAMAKDPNGLSYEAIQQVRHKTARFFDELKLLSDLADEGYVTETAGSTGKRWRFASSLLQAWWLKWQT